MPSIESEHGQGRAGADTSPQRTLDTLIARGLSEILARG